MVVGEGGGCVGGKYDSLAHSRIALLNKDAGREGFRPLSQAVRAGNNGNDAAQPKTHSKAAATPASRAALMRITVGVGCRQRRATRGIFAARSIRRSNVMEAHRKDGPREGV